jgi:hypothetical protein
MAYLWRIGLGAIVGLALGAVLYVVTSNWLDQQTGGLRALQGLSWNLVPGLFIVGGLAGWVWAAKSQR